jgi:hypothetical protein
MDGNRDRAFVAAILVFLPETSQARSVLQHYWSEEHMLGLDNDPSIALRYPPRGPMFSRACQATIERALAILELEVSPCADCEYSRDGTVDGCNLLMGSKACHKAQTRSD